MSSLITDWGAGKLLSIVLGLTPQPTTCYAALTTDEPGAQADGTTINVLEPPFGTGYARQPVPMGVGNWSDPTGTHYSATLNTVSFGIPISSWGRISYFALCDSLTGGNIYFYGAFDTPAVPDSTYIFNIPPGGLILSFVAVQPSIVVT